MHHFPIRGKRQSVGRNRQNREKKASAIKFKGNRKQFELNLHSNSILTQIEGSVENSSEVLKLVAEGKQLTKERQKLIKIADRNKEGWLIV